jgi:hypothetical protein
VNGPRIPKKWKKRKVANSQASPIDFPGLRKSNPSNVQVVLAEEDPEMYAELRSRSEFVSVAKVALGFASDRECDDDEVHSATIEDLMVITAPRMSGDHFLIGLSMPQNFLSAPEPETNSSPHQEPSARRPSPSPSPRDSIE